MPVYSDSAGLRGFHVTTVDGHRLGRVEEVYLDTTTSRPEWAAVTTGLFGTGLSLLPLSALDWTDIGSELTVALTRDQIIGAPKHPAGTQLSRSGESELVAYYRAGDLRRAG